MTIERPVVGLSSVAASGNCGLLMLSISVSNSWLSPTMYRFISSAGNSAYSTTAGSIVLAVLAIPAGAAYNERAGIQIALPSIVCGRENFQRTLAMRSGLLRFAERAGGQ